MTVIATASNPRFTVSRVDIDRAGPTYTIDTLRDLAASAPTPSCSSSPEPTPWPRSSSWKDADELFELAHFIGVTRPGYHLSETGLPADRVTLAGGSGDGDQLDRLPGAGRRR